MLALRAMRGDSRGATLELREAYDALDGAGDGVRTDGDVGAAKLPLRRLGDCIAG